MKVLTGRDQRVLRLLQQLKRQCNDLHGMLDTAESIAANALRQPNRNRTDLVGALTAILLAAKGCGSKMVEETLRIEMAFSRLGLPVNAILPGRAVKKRKAPQRLRRTPGVD